MIESRRIGGKGSKGTVIFDLDGTLHHTEKALVPAIRSAMADLGFTPAMPEVINALYGEPLEIFCRTLTGDAGLVKEFRSALRKHQAGTIPRQGALYPGTKKMLEELTAAGFVPAICSNAGTDYIRLVTETLGIARFFPVIAGRDGNISKTGRVGRIIRDTRAESAVMVGDRYHDFQAAKENGIPSIGCLYGYGSSEELTAADALVENPGEIPRTVITLLGITR